MKKNTKGFTLIELLAVIVILAIIALIATPLILNIINRARKSAAADSAYAVRKEAQMFYQFENMTATGLTEDVKVDFTGGSIALKKADGTTAYVPKDSENKFELDGTIPSEGVITITRNGNISGAVEISGYWCAVKNKGAISCDYSSKSEAEAAAIS